MRLAAAALLFCVACSEPKEPPAQAPTPAPAPPASEPSIDAASAAAASDEPSAETKVVALSLAKLEKGDGTWKVWVDVEFRNGGAKPLAIDKVTGCEGGRIRNRVFEVIHEGKEIEYQGMMAKRAHPGPDGFWVLEPGASHSERVDLGEVYALPASGSIAVRFDHYNHFSVDEIQLVSEPLTIELAE